MKTVIRKGRVIAKSYGLKAVDTGAGIYEAIVSVFGNVDYHGDRIIPGAFSASLERWKASGDPIPVIFSHQWDDLDAHVGAVLESRELMPGDALLPPELKDNGGLWTRFKLDVEEDFAGRLAKRLTDRRIKEFSFAYDVLDERRGTDGVNELVELDVLEVGPTLKGANPATRLLSSALGDDTERILSIIVAGAKATPHAPVAGEGSASGKCVLCGLDPSAAQHGTKAQVTVDFEGSIETELEGVFRAALEWARGGDIGNGGFYAVYLEATYPSEGRAVVLVEGWDDPWGEGVFYELSYAKNEDDTFSVSDPHEIEVVVDVVRKARAMKHYARPQSATAAAVVDTFESEPNGNGNGKSRGRKVRGEVVGTEAGDDGGDPALVEIELAELDMT